MDKAISKFSLYKWGAVPSRTKCCKCGDIYTSDDRIVLVQVSTVPDMWEVECLTCHKLEDREW